MRTFTLGSGMDRKFVLLELQGRRLRVTQGKADGTTKKTDKELPSEADARAAAERLIGELRSHGYTEQGSSTASSPAKPKSARSTAAVPKPAARRSESDGLDMGLLAEAGEGDAVAEAVLPRLAPAPGADVTAEAAPKKKKKKKSGKKKAKAAGSADGLDKRVLAGMAAVGVGLVAFLGYFVYDAFLKPPTIVGHWEGTRIEYEIGKPIVRTSYKLVLDDQKRVSMTLQERVTSSGTYALQGDLLKLSLKDEEGNTDEVKYKVSLGRATLDLFDPESGKKAVQLVRFRDKPSVGGGAAPPSTPKDLADGAADKGADEKLASVSFSPKDGAFRLRYPGGWEAETGSRPDNTYSWARFTKGSAKIQVYADVAGSLMSGPGQAQNLPEGSELAPVHNAHELYQKTVAKEYSDFKESAPALFKGSALGEGRVATFTASGGGLFGSKLQGYRVTLLSNDRRITVLCEAPSSEFESLKPTFLAVCRSVSR
jgi:predicted DNA-binding WGR domain protein